MSATNTKEKMNEISILNDFIISEFQSNALVNTISIVETETIDLNKENIYPLVNVDLLDTDVLDDAIIASYTMTIVQARDIVPRKTDSKLLSDTNYIDNINETHSIAVRFINVLTRQNNDENIGLDNLSSLRVLKDWRSGLDGVQFEIDLSIPNLGTSC
jgi:hypothetical protein